MCAQKKQSNEMRGRECRENMKRKNKESVCEGGKGEGGTRWRGWKTTKPSLGLA